MGWNSAAACSSGPATAGGASCCRPLAAGAASAAPAGSPPSCDSLLSASVSSASGAPSEGPSGMGSSGDGCPLLQPLLLLSLQSLAMPSGNFPGPAKLGRAPARRLVAAAASRQPGCSQTRLFQRIEKFRRAKSRRRKFDQLVDRPTGTTHAGSDSLLAPWFTSCASGCSSWLIYKVSGSASLGRARSAGK